MKIILTIFLVFVSFSFSHAERVYLESGDMVEGPIVARSDEIIKIDVSGIPITYYFDEITRIESDTGQVMYPVDTPADQEDQDPAKEPQVVVPNAFVDVKKPEADPVDKKKLILEFVDVFGTKEMLYQNFNQSLMRVPINERKQIQEAFSVDELIEDLVPLYDKHFTTEDLQKLVDFYNSDIGEKLRKNAPVIMQETVGVSLQYFQKKMKDKLSIEN